MSGAFGRRSSFARGPGSKRYKTMPDFLRLIARVVVMHHASSILAAAVVVATATLAQAQGAAPPPAKPEMMQSCPGLVAARPPFAAKRRTAACGARTRSGSPDICRPFDLPDRKPATRAHRHRLQ